MSAHYRTRSHIALLCRKGVFVFSAFLVVFSLSFNFFPQPIFDIHGRLSFESAVQTTYAATSTWSGTNWTLYDTITIEADEINEDLTDFPVYVDLADLSASFWGTVSDGGGDIRVTTNDSSPTEVPREVVFASTSLQTGELHFKASTISSSTDTVFRIYYSGSTTAAYADTDTYGAQNVWTNNYFGVWHMQQDPTGTIYDSTANGRDGISGGAMTSSDLVDGMVGDAVNFDGVDDYINVGSFSETLSDLSVSAWVRPETYGEANSRGLILGLVPSMYFGTYGGSDYDLMLGTNFNSATGLWSSANESVYQDTFQHVYGEMTTVTDTTTDGVFYIDNVGTSVDEDTTPAGSFVQPSGDLYIGNYSHQDDTFDGEIDELRFSSTTRSAAWISAEFVNQKTPNSFYTINRDLAQTWNASDWVLYDTITIDAAQVDATLTDFPVYVDLTDLSSQFWSTTDSTYPGVDIRVTNSSNIELPRELVFASSTAQTGELHFKADSISSSADTTFKIWYNGTTTDDYETHATYGAENVWSNEYIGVWHMQEDPSGVIYDSTSNNLDALAGGSMTSADSVAGSLGSAVEFDGSNDVLNTGVFEADLGSMTVSAWIDLNSYGEAGFGRVVQFGDGTNGLTTFVTGNGFNRLQSMVVYTTTTGEWYTGSDTIVTGTPQYIVWNKDDLNAPTGVPSVAIDGVDETVTVGTSGSGTYTQSSGGRFLIGNTPDTTRTFDGSFDEVRIASTTRSTAWITAEHLNQATTTDFYTVTAFTPAAVVWNASDWTFYDSITIDSANIDATLTDFPVYIDLSDLSSRFWSTTPSSASLVGTDIRVTNSSDQELPRELVFASSTAQTGELHFKADSISSSADTTFKIWYNGTTTGDYATSSAYGAQNVWTNGYVGVWHMNEDPSGTVIDSTVYGRSATTTGAMTNGDVVTGAVGKAINFDGDDKINTGALESMTFDAVSTEIWVRPTSIGDSWRYLAWAGGTFGSRILGFGVDLYSFANSYSGLYGDWNSPSGSVTTSNFQHMYFGRDVTATTTDAVIYKNASSLTITEDSTPDGTFVQPDGTQALTLGDQFIGDLDEIRVATTTRSDAWISAAYLNQSTTTDFYATSSPIFGSSTISNNDGGQVSNAFSGLNKTNEPLFSFKITPNSGNATVTEAVISLTGVSNVTAADFSNVRLYQDDDNDAAYDAGDTMLDATGVMSVGGQTGSITFDSDFVVTTETNYVVIADWNAPERGTYMTVSLPVAGLTLVDHVGMQDVYGSVSSVQHIRGNQGAGGSSARVGSAAPAGDGDVGGGEQGGGDAFDSNTSGDTIGSETDFYWPSAQSGSWTSGTNAYDQTDGTYATTNTTNTNDYTSYTHNVPSTDTVEGIEVKLEVSGTTAAGNIGVELTWDGGGSFTSTGYNTGNLTMTDAVVTLGGPSDKWGHSWTAEQVNNTNFGIRVTGNPSSNTVQIDEIQVKIFHQASGGSGGGGGRF